MHFKQSFQNSFSVYFSGYLFPTFCGFRGRLKSIGVDLSTNSTEVGLDALTDVRSAKQSSATQMLTAAFKLHWYFQTTFLFSSCCIKYYIYTEIPLATRVTYLHM